jgi:nicotinamide mononucleotide transporter
MTTMSDEHALIVSRSPRITLAEYVIAHILSAGLIAASLSGVANISLTEVLGFITGGACVWLIVREHVANWPVGIANNVLFFVLFWQSSLYADACLQIVYVILAVYGWRIWLRGGDQASVRSIAPATAGEWLGVALFVPLGVWGLCEILIVIQGAAPFADALTTVLSLAAQFLMCRKRLEHWYFWIAADIIYIPLYWSRDLPLTAVLYVVFLVMCLFGLRAWRRSYRADTQGVAV